MLQQHSIDKPQMDLYDFMNHADMGGPEGQGSSSWGWAAPNGREFGIVGQFSGAAFVEVLKNGKLQYLGRLPAQSVGSRWREIRVLNDYVIIGSEAVGHNVQSESTSISRLQTTMLIRIQFST
jgi:hypothetical protein